MPCGLRKARLPSRGALKIAAEIAELRTLVPKYEKGWNNPALLPSTGHNGSASPACPPRLSRRLSRSVGGAVLRRADHAWSDLAFPDLRHPWRDVIRHRTSAAQASKFRQCRAGKRHSCQGSVNLLSNPQRGERSAACARVHPAVSLRGTVLSLC